MPTYCEKISQIQIGGLQPCDDLTWNDPLFITDYALPDRLIICSEWKKTCTIKSKVLFPLKTICAVV